MTTQLNLQFQGLFKEKNLLVIWVKQSVTTAQSYCIYLAIRQKLNIFLMQLHEMS